MSQTRGAMAAVALVLGCATVSACSGDTAPRDEPAPPTRVTSAKVDAAMLNAGKPGVEHGSLIGTRRGGQRLWEEIVLTDAPRREPASFGRANAKRRLDRAIDAEIRKDELDEAIKDAVTDESRALATPELPEPPANRVFTTSGTVPAPPPAHDVTAPR